MVQAYNPSTWEAEAADCEIGGPSGLQSNIQTKSLQWSREEAGSEEAQVYTSIYYKFYINAEGTPHDFA